MNMLFGILVVGLKIAIFLDGCYGKETNDADVPVVCEKTHFEENYNNKNNTIMEKKFKEYQRICGQSVLECGAGDVYVAYAEEKAVKRYWWIFSTEELHKSKGCWGIFMGVMVDKKIISHSYVNFKTEKQFENFSAIYIPVIEGKDYQFVMYPIPNGKEMIVDMRAPDKCENEVLEKLYDKFGRECIDTLDFKEKFNMTRKLCDIFLSNVHDRDEFIEKYVNLTADCNLIITKPDESGTTILTTTNIILIALTATLMLSIIILTTVYMKCYRRVKKINSIHNNLTHLEDVKRQSYASRDQTQDVTEAEHLMESNYNVQNILKGRTNYDN